MRQCQIVCCRPAECYTLSIIFIISLSPPCTYSHTPVRTTPSSYKPQKISPKFQGTVRELLHKKIREFYIHPQFVSDVMRPMRYANCLFEAGLIVYLVNDDREFTVLVDAS